TACHARAHSGAPLAGSSASTAGNISQCVRQPNSTIALAPPLSRSARRQLRRQPRLDDASRVWTLSLCSTLSDGTASRGDLYLPQVCCIGGSFWNWIEAPSRRRRQPELNMLFSQIQ